MKSLLWIITASFGLVFLGSCRSTQKLTEQGNYDNAIRLSVQRLAGKKKKKADEVWVLEDAFFKANARDMERIQQLRGEGRPENWAKIYDLARKVDRRQDLVRPLVPLRDNKGREAKFRFVKINGIIQEAKNKAAQHLYELATTEMILARQGDKRSAREAYEHLDNIKQYVPRYKNREVLMEEALVLGTQYVLFKVKQDRRAILSRDFERALLSIDVRDMNSRWRIYDTEAQRGVQYDYELVLMLENLEVSPERVRERSYRDEKEIEDGERVLLDDNGDTVKDSSGNVIKVPILKVIAADILEVHQTKEAIVTGRLMAYDRRRQRLIEEESVTAEALFEHYAATYRGDRRALSKESRRVIGNSPRDFPSDEMLLLEAVESLKPIVKQKIKRMKLPI
ncbi:MAG: hypothetical protein AAGI23_05910 [Bacteroidota bacterium]